MMGGEGVRKIQNLCDFIMNDPLHNLLKNLWVIIKNYLKEKLKVSFWGLLGLIFGNLIFWELVFLGLIFRTNIFRLLTYSWFFGFLEFSSSENSV